MKLLKTICVLGLTLCLATSVYAGTQSVKLSGDVAIRGIFRDHYNLSTPAATTDTRTGGTRPEQEFFMSTVEAQIDADLTDNVSTVIRLVNQRDWNIHAKSITAGTTSLAPNGRGGYTANDDEFDIILDLAYLELKEFLYSPLTLKVGRQDLWFGKGFIVGTNQQAIGNGTAGSNISAGEYTAINSFDSIRATLDYDPWTVDFVYANIYGNTIQANDGINLYGANVSYIFDTYNAESEAYYWYKADRQIEPTRMSNNDVYCLGLRGSGDPIEDWTVAAEGAYQFGNSLAVDTQQQGRDRSAYAVDVSAECRVFADQYAWKPVLAAEYIYYSGDRHAADLDSNAGKGEVSGTNSGWDPMYRGKFDTAYREFVGKYNVTKLFPARARFYQSYADSSFTNQHQALLNTQIMPTDSLTCNGVLGFFWLDEDISQTYTDDYIGTELDLVLSWDYTEDVTFGLLGAWFFAGDLYDNDEDNVATDIVGTVSLSF